MLTKIDTMYLTVSLKDHKQLCQKRDHDNCNSKVSTSTSYRNNISYIYRNTITLNNYILFKTCIVFLLKIYSWPMHQYFFTFISMFTCTLTDIHVFLCIIFTIIIISSSITILPFQILILCCSCCLVVFCRCFFYLLQYYVYMSMAICNIYI